MISIDSKQQYEASVNITKLHVESILQQSMIMKEKTSDGKTETELKYETRSRISEMKNKDNTRRHLTIFNSSS